MMDMDTKISTDMDVADIKARYDHACKTLLAEKYIFMATAPSTKEPIQLIINVEAQNDFSPGYPLIKRALYYCARMISAQYGTEFDKMDYGKIKKVYSIWICIDPPKKRRGTITAYKVREHDLVGKAGEPTANYDLLTVVMVCLGGKRRKAVLRLLNTLLSKTTATATKKKVLARDFNIPMSVKFEKGVKSMCNLSEGVYKSGYDKGKIQDIRTLMKTAKVTKEKAMDLLEIPPEKREAYGKLV